MKWNRVLAVTSLVAVGALTACGDDDNPTDPGVDPPAAVTNLTASSDRSSDTSVWQFDVTATWDESADATGYTASFIQGDDTTSTTVAASSGASASTTFSGTGGGAFTVEVVATNSGGSSPAASASGENASLNETFFNMAGYNNLEADPGFDASVFEFGTLASPPDFTLTAMPAGYTPATLPTDGFVAPTDGRTLPEAAAYAGAIMPGTSLANAWYNGWTIWSESGSDSRDVSGAPQVTLPAAITADRTLFSDTVYVLEAPTFVGVDCGIDGMAAGCVSATLTIEPGTTIIGRKTTDLPAGTRGAYLVISRGSMIVADATSGADRAPTEAETIVFTSASAPGSMETGDWGGLVINGSAPTNAGDEATGEGDSGLYGGNDVDDDSGILRGVRIEYAGDDVTPTDQLNGLALQGVGSATTVSYVQIHYNQDDGIEPFGGTVSVDHLVVTGIGDDSVDGTDGYRGVMQYILGQQDGLNADNGFELSNNGDDESAAPQGTALVANATMIGAGQNVVSGGIAGPESDNGIQLREGSYYGVFNSIVVGFGEGGFCIRDAGTIANALARMNGSTTRTEVVLAEGLIMWDNQSPGAADNFAACGGGSS